MIITPEPVLRAMQKRYFEWVAEPVTGTKYVYFEPLLKDAHGVDVVYSNNKWHTKTIVDEQKYAMFLLKYT